MSERLLGTWRLVDYTLHFGEGDQVQPLGANPFGRLIYLPGLMSAHLMAEADAPVSYMSYCGPWRVDGDVAYHTVESCDWPGVVGQVLKRGIEWQDEALVLIANGAPHEGRRGQGRLTWHRTDWDEHPRQGA